MRVAYACGSISFTHIFMSHTHRQIFASFSYSYPHDDHSLSLYLFLLLFCFSISNFPFMCSLHLYKHFGSVADGSFFITNAILSNVCMYLRPYPSIKCSLLFLVCVYIFISFDIVFGGWFGVCTRKEAGSSSNRTCTYLRHRESEQKEESEILKSEKSLLNKCNKRNDHIQKMLTVKHYIWMCASC